MDLFDNGVLTLKCSPIKELGGNKTFLVNVFFTTGGFDGKYCGVQLPQYHLVYNDGFTEDEIIKIKDHLYENEEALWNEASMRPPTEVNPDDYDYIP